MGVGLEWQSAAAERYRLAELEASQANSSAWLWAVSGGGHGLLRHILGGLRLQVMETPAGNGGRGPGV